MKLEANGGDTMAAREHTGNLSYGPLTQRDDDFIAGVLWERARAAKVAEAWGREGNTVHPFTLDIADKIRSGA